MQSSRIRLLVADDNKQFVQSLKNHLWSVDDIDLVGVAYGGLAVLKEVKKQMPDVILLDSVLPELDGLGVLDQLRQMPLLKVPRVIALSIPGQEFVETAMLERGADACMCKPVDMDRLCDTVRVCVRTAKPSIAVELNGKRDALIVSFLNRLQMSSRLDGYAYLRYCVGLVSTDVTYLRAITTRLYPMAAMEFNTTPERVERSIRHAIESTINRTSLDALYSLFGNTIDPQKGKPTNGEFVAMMAEYVRLGMEQVAL